MLSLPKYYVSSLLCVVLSAMRRFQACQSCHDGHICKRETDAYTDRKRLKRERHEMKAMAFPRASGSFGAVVRNGT